MQLVVMHIGSKKSAVFVLVVCTYRPKQSLNEFGVLEFCVV